MDEAAEASYGTEGLERYRPAGKIENDVIIGDNGYLFLANGGHRVLEYCSGVLAPSENSITDFYQNIADRAQDSARLGANYIHVISPDKQTVLVDQFPFKQTAQMGKLFLERAGNVSRYLLYPTDFLRRSNHQTYQKTDTHMTDAGSIVVTKAILEAIGDDWISYGDDLELGLTGNQNWTGDLGSKLTPQVSENRITFVSDKHDIWYHNNIVGGNNGIVDIRFNKAHDSGRRLLIFGDSFGRDLARFLSFFYFQTVFFRTPFYHPEIASQIRPTAIITQNVERYLPSVVSDNNRPSFFMYPFINNLDYKPSKDFALALSSVLSFGRPPYDKYIAEL